jgi:hypothetical protein
MTYIGKKKYGVLFKIGFEKAFDKSQMAFPLPINGSKGTTTHMDGLDNENSDQW